MTYSVLLLVPFGVVVGVGLTFVWLASRQNGAAGLSSPEPGDASLPAAAPGQRTFRSDPPQRWIAVRSRNPEAVQRAIGLHNASPCSWSEGLSQLDDHQLFVSPAVHGWVLVFGNRLPEPADDIDACFRFLSRLSEQLGEVQFFHQNRVLGHHAWARFNGGRAFRGYAWVGETLWNHGPRTWAEKRLGLTCFDYFEPRERPHFADLEQLRVNTDRVPALAAIWSIDPGGVDERALGDASGVAGEIPRPQLS